MPSEKTPPSFLACNTTPSRFLSGGVALAVASSIGSSLAALFQTQATKTLSPLVVASIGNLIGGILIFVILRIGNLPARVKLSKDIFKVLIIFVALRGVIGGILFNVALSYTVGIKAIFFTKAEPYFVLFWHWLLDGTKVPNRHLTLLFIHLLGAALLSGITLTHFDSTQIGDLLILVAVCILAYSYRLGGKLSHELGSLQTNSLLQISSGLILLPLAYLYLPASLPSINLTYNNPWVYLFGYVILFNVISLSLWLIALRLLDHWKISALRAIGPLVAAPVAWAFFGDRLSILQILGGTVILSTSALIARDKAH